MGAILDELTQYSNDVISGKIVSCQKHRWACERFIRDLEKQHDENYPYYFDEDCANHFFDFSGLFKHSKGELAGKHIELHVIIKFIAGNVYGWRHKKTGYRRFTKFYWQVARKNAKSQLLSLIALYELFFCKEVAEIYCAATKTKQAKIVFNEALAMLKSCDQEDIRSVWKFAYGKISYTFNDSFIDALSKDDEKSGDGFNVQCAIIDEYHAHKTTEIYDVLDSGMGARPNPLFGIITTAGFDLNNPCYRVEYDLVSRLLNPDMDCDIESYFAMVNELETNTTSENIIINGVPVEPGGLIDDINNPTIWEKANPVICSHETGYNYIAKKIEEAQQSPEKMRNLKTKHFNIWINEREFGYMSMPKWAAQSWKNVKSCTSFDNFESVIEGNTKKICRVGLDLAAKIDLTGCSFEFIGDNGEYYLTSYGFMPEEKFHERMKNDRVRYDLWERDGWLIVTPGAVTDYRFVKQFMKNKAEKCGWTIEEVCADPWCLAQLGSDLISDGLTVIEIIQGYKTLSEPTKNFRESVYSGSLIHSNSPVLTWCVSNAIARIDHNENIILDKSKSKHRIDLAAASINAHVRTMVDANTRSIYETRGMLTL